MFIDPASPKAVLIAALAVTALLAGDLLSARNGVVLHMLGTSDALADDDDDGGDDDGGGGDDDDDDDDGGRGASRSSRSSSSRDGSVNTRDGSGGRTLLDIFRRRSAPPARRSVVRRAQVPVPPPPAHASDEIVGLGLTPSQLDQLSASGFDVLEQNTMAAFNTEAVKLRIPSGLTLEAAQQQIDSLAPGAAIDFNHYYRPEQYADRPCATTDCLARTVIGWPTLQERPSSCASGVRMGLVDTAINPDHSVFEGGNIEIIQLAGSDDLPESGRQHGTAVAALLIGSPASRTPGLVPGGKLIAVNAFYRAKHKDDRTDVYGLVRALDLLAERQVDVINLSLAGPENLLLQQAVKKVAERGIIMVAAAGNEGPESDPVYPAAYEEVVAVTAIDRRKRPYRRAGRGQHIDFAAPGVEVWTAASIRGARPKTGTSFAAPFVTAAAVLMKGANPELTPEHIRKTLIQRAEDLGEPGKDPVFGHGLLDARAICTAAP